MQLILDGKKTKAVEALKQKLVSLSILALARSYGQYIINTDLSETQVECILFQEQKYKSRNLSDSGQAHSVPLNVVMTRRTRNV